MADTKISALTQFNPAGSDLLSGVNLGGPTTQAARVDAVGGRILLEEHTVAAQAAIPFTTRNVGNWTGASIQVDFDDYELRVTNLVNGSAAILAIQCSTNGGVSYDTGTNYDWTWDFLLTGSSGQIGGAAATSLQWRNANTTLNANGSWDGHLHLSNPGSAALFKSFLGQLIFRDGTSGLIVLNGGGQYLSATAVNAFKIFPSAGTLTGTARLYGIRK